MARTRTFIAVELGKAVRERIVKLQDSLASAASEVKWVEPENLHVTLLFLGEVDDREVHRVCRIAVDSASGQPGFVMTVESAGCFPNPRHPRILWVGVGQGARELIGLHDALEEPLMQMGYRREDRPYTPHITIGRVRSARSTEALANALVRQGGWQGGEVGVGELLVMGSELMPRGPVYTILGRAPLGRG
jgi:2'-5' RNA ligase